MAFIVPILFLVDSLFEGGGAVFGVRWAQSLVGETLCLSGSSCHDHVPFVLLQVDRL